MIRPIIAAMIFIMIMSAASFSQVKQIGINPLSLNFGARPSSLGDAYTAVSDDLNSGFYNPASLIKNKGLVFSYLDSSNFSIAVLLKKLLIT